MSVEQTKITKTKNTKERTKDNDALVEWERKRWREEILRWWTIKETTCWYNSLSESDRGS